jgi:hypothetical protein
MTRNLYRTVAAYVAGLAVIGGLMAVVALGGNAVPKPPVVYSQIPAE